jgi:DNA-binding MarR family transcriptional regulator
MMVGDMSATSSRTSASRSDRPLPRDRRLAFALLQLDVHRRAEEQRTELGVAGGRLLWLLSDRRPRTLREIAAALKLEQSTVNRQVNAAMRSGLLSRVDRSSVDPTGADPTSATMSAGRPAGGAQLIGPTETGLAAYEREVTQALQAYDAALGALGTDDAAVFLELLERFVDAYGEALG